MTALDLAAICERHDVKTCVFPTAGGRLEQWQAWHGGQGFHGATEADAVCALLKARWGITTTVLPDFNVIALHTRPEHDARNDPPSQSQRFPTELAAVVALADRLAAPAPERAE